MSISIRKAERKDCHQLLGLVKELAIYEKAPNEVTVTLHHFEESGFGQQPVWWAFVAEDTDKKNQENESLIIGFALYYIRYSTWKGQRMYLEDIIVTDDYRGRGIGQLLMDSLIKEAKEKEFHGIVWQVLDWNEPAINFYKKYNAHFDPEWINVSLVVD